ncbi:hypothetical protein PS876_01610 [Pseudomonas fluorescens]|uniref:restriction endonuclease subunit S n=1 Tax=Pseudomonas fluorescens TaxID=294 RepID=UPI00123FE64D|nr:restriction endonuclease subunit S [Pseudomonas fluorescens]VVO77234.1 hypothetical protein PS876_01610 [Pseudomonas fluorescens]
MTQDFRLGDVASITAGQTFRGRSETDGEIGFAKLLQIKDVKEGVYPGGDLPWAAVEEERLTVRLRGGELLLPLRGNRSDTMLYLKRNEVPTTTPNQVAIITPCQENLNPFFLLWFLNSGKGRAQIDSMRTGSTVGHISVKALKTIEITIPGQESQQSIASVYENWLRQREVLSEMLIRGAELAETICYQMLNDFRGK